MIYRNRQPTANSSKLMAAAKKLSANGYQLIAKASKGSVNAAS